MQFRNHLKLFLVTGFSALLVGALFFLGGTREVPAETKEIHVSGAARSLDYWFAARTYPHGNLEVGKWANAHQEHQQRISAHKSQSTTWEALGPGNVAGRTLCLEFHPTDPDVIWAGSACGGLWKTTNGGDGPNGWSYVSTGFPVLGVGAIAVNPQNPDEIYIGTGEVYNDQETGNRVAIRTTRGSYGIGILKTTDGGATWSKTLD